MKLKTAQRLAFSVPMALALSTAAFSAFLTIITTGPEIIDGWMLQGTGLLALLAVVSIFGGLIVDTTPHRTRQPESRELPLVQSIYGCAACGRFDVQPAFCSCEKSWQFDAKVPPLLVTFLRNHVAQAQELAREYHDCLGALGFAASVIEPWTPACEEIITPRLRRCQTSP